MHIFMFSGTNQDQLESTFSFRFHVTTGFIGFKRSFRPEVDDVEHINIIPITSPKYTHTKFRENRIKTVVVTVVLFR